MKTIESIKNEIVKLNNEMVEGTKNPNWMWSKECELISHKIDNLSEEVFEMGYGFKFNWVDEDIKFSSSVIKVDENMFIAGSVLLSGSLEIDLRSEHMGISRIFDTARDYEIELDFDIFKI